MQSGSITLAVAGTGDAALLNNLMQLYIYDLSEIFPKAELGPDGRFAYPDLPSYLEGSSARCGFLIRYEERVAGFILIR